MVPTRYQAGLRRFGIDRTRQTPHAGHADGARAAAGTIPPGGRPTRDRAGPFPLLPTDGELDFDAKHHHDQQQEKEMCHHLRILRALSRRAYPAGSFVLVDVS